MRDDRGRPPRGDSPGDGTGARPARVASKRRRFLRLTFDSWMRGFFVGSATIAILVLALIMVFLFREGMGFVPEHRRGLTLYRQTGQEFVDAIRGPLVDHRALNRYLGRVRAAEAEGLRGAGRDGVADFERFADDFRGAGVLLREFVDRAEEIARDVRGRAAAGEAVDFSREAAALRALLPEAEVALREFRSSVEAAVAGAPAPKTAASRRLWERFLGMAGRLAESAPAAHARAAAWDPGKPVRLSESLAAFFLGRHWVTNSEWHDRYGLLPLLVGSLCIAAVALGVAVPFSVAAAIFVSEFASPWERGVIKPAIEFIAAIPSIVLGFFGITVLGGGIQWLSQQPWLSWVPFFPIAERLNIATAGLMLALMACPTIFTLAEEALGNVPRAFSEGSLALGATRFQTVARMVVPAAASGIMAAVLLGFGRVVGETMVVLLVAGNRLEIPDFSLGMGALFQPAHTMTGIIAQELGEVPKGSLHYRALFMVGVALFVIALAVNYCAELVMRRFRREGY